MRRRLLVLFTLVAMVAFPYVVRAQENGSIDGFVTDQTGNPLRGVKIVAESKEQIGKGRTAYTTAEGTFHIGGLTPGKFKVTATSPGLETVILEKVKVDITTAAEVNLMMEVKTTQEVVRHVERIPVISTTKPVVKQSYDAELVEVIPFRDTVNQFRDVMLSAPGVTNLRVRGGGVTGTIFMEDGFQIKDNFPPIRSAQAFEAQTAAYGADAPTASGGVSNMVTRSGSNQFMFEFSALTVPAHGQFFTDNLDSSSGMTRYMINPTVSGPIIRDKLWYHVNFELTATKIPNTRDPLLILPDPSPQFNVFPKLVTKLSWQVSPRNKLDLLVNADTPYYQNRITTAGVADSAQEDRLAQRYFTGLTWESLLSDNLLFRSQAGWLGYFENIYPANCRTGNSSTCYDLPLVKQTLPEPLQYQNSQNHTLHDQQSVQFINSLEYFLSTARAGEHKIRLRDFVFIERNELSNSINGNYLYELAGPAPSGFRTEYFANDPRLAPAQYGAFVGTTNTLQHVLTLSDTWKPNRRVTAIPSLSFIQATGSNNKGTFPLSTWTWTPGLSLVWDVRGNAKTVLRTSGNIYVDVDYSNVSRFAIGSQVSQRCQYNPTTLAYDTNCTYSGGIGNNKVANLVIPRTWEFTLGGARELAEGLSLGLDFVYRKFTNQYEDYETNRIWNDSGTTILGTADGTSQTANILQTISGANRRWMGVTAQLTKTEGRLRVESSYTWSRLDGTVLDGFQNYYGTIPSQDRTYGYGPLADDHRHEIKLVGRWQAEPWLAFGVRYTYMSGMPRNRLFYNNVTGTWTNYKAPNGQDPGNDINTPYDNYTLRLPDTQDLNAQVRLQLLPLIKHDISMYLEILNVLALRTATAIGSFDGNNYGLVTTRMAPFTTRIGIDYKWQ